MRPIRTESAPAPVAGAPYSQAVVAAPGEMVFVSGQLPIDPATGALAEGDAGASRRGWPSRTSRRSSPRPARRWPTSRKTTVYLRTCRPTSPR